MNDNGFRTIRAFTRAEALVRSVTGDRFGREILNFIEPAGRIRNFGAYYFTGKSLTGPVLSFWYGSISSYWFRKNAADLISSVDFRERTRSQVLSVSPRKVAVTLWRPPEDHPVHRLYKRVGVLERIGVSSRTEGSSSQSFFLRSRSDGPISARELEKFCQVLPLAHELINLRHRILGSEAFALLPSAAVSGLRARGIVGFLRLTPRETDVCDCASMGLTVKGTASRLGMAESSVRTLRQRSYRKLNVVSAHELLAMIAKESTAGFA